MTGDGLAELMQDAARELERPLDPSETMQVAVRLAVDHVTAATSAGITTVRRGGRVQTEAHAGDLALGADRLQYELDEGPCLDSIWGERTVLGDDLAADGRWPVWGPRVAAEVGARSVLSLQLFVQDDTAGALNLYAPAPRAFAEADRDIALALATHVALALASTREIEGLHLALDTRTVIGQATGVVMERFGLSPEEAMSLLRRLSSTTNVKLRDLAEQIVATREVPQG